MTLYLSSLWTFMSVCVFVNRFNYRSTHHLTTSGFYEFLKWFDERAWYPLGRIVGGTVSRDSVLSRLNSASSELLEELRPVPVCSCRSILVWWWPQVWFTTSWTSSTWASTSGTSACSWHPSSVHWLRSPPSCWRGSCGVRGRGFCPPASWPSCPDTSRARWLGPSITRPSPYSPCSSPTSCG